ncbi:hypothetical protein [Exiguobacterium sp. H66]|uniref:homing endonuclease associated repeat-containing protein n=1 Tax=Exiguobacterium sp. H66 TaxID=2751208 RepID=UPI001BE6F198|nr:hypothetical protein [Exiguobacterium sp. H66]
MRKTTHALQPDLTDYQKIIRLIQGLHHIHPEPMRAAHYQKLAAYLPYPPLEELEQRFDSWTNLLQEAGVITEGQLTPAELSTLNRPKPGTGPKKRWTVEQSIAHYVETYGTRVTIKRYSDLRETERRMVSSNTIIRHYGTWKNALEQFALSSNGCFTNEDCLNGLRQAADELGDRLTSQTYARWAREHQAPSLTLLIERFSSWREAVRYYEAHDFEA